MIENKGGGGEEKGKRLPPFLDGFFHHRHRRPNDGRERLSEEESMLDRRCQRCGEIGAEIECVGKVARSCNLPHCLVLFQTLTVRLRRNP